MSEEIEKSPVTYELRPVRAEDDPFLLRVYAHTRADELALVPWSDEQKVAFLRQQLEAQSRYYMSEYPEAEHTIVLVDGAPVGRLYVRRMPDAIRILDFAILIERRRAGIGSAVLGDLIAESTETGRPLSVYVETFNPSLNLFERLGFCAIEENGMHRLLEIAPSRELDLSASGG